jgi:hypothetical protein
MVTVAERLLANASLMKRQLQWREERQNWDVVETIKTYLKVAGSGASSEVSFRTFQGMGSKPVYIETKKFADFLEEMEKIPAIALDRGDDILVDGVYNWRTNHATAGAGCGNWIRVPVDQWDRFATFMKGVLTSIGELEAASE